MPPCKAYWYEGLNPDASGDRFGGLHAAVGTARNLPALAIELQAKYPDEFITKGDSGSLYVGEKGVIFTATYGGTISNPMHVVPMEKMDEIKQPPRTLPRPKENPFVDFVETVRAGRTDTATPFEYGARLTEFCLLGNLAQHAGKENLVAWDSHKMKVTNIPELNQWLKRKDRKGWAV
jgi:hypothetical protein